MVVKWWGGSQKYSDENNNPTLYLMEHMAVTSRTRRIIKRNKRHVVSEMIK